MMSNFETRMIDKFDFPFSENQKFLNPEKVFVIFSKGFSIDFGALCYLNRGDSKFKRNAGRVVDLDSYCPRRSESISNLLNLVMDKNYRQGQTKKTKYFHCFHFVSFINWCDKSGNQDVLETQETTKKHYQSYVKHLNEKVNQGILKVQTAYRCQRAILIVLEDFYSDENFGRGINRISQLGHLPLHTEVPDHTSQHQVLAWAQSLFDGFTDLVINQKQYPFALNVPTYLNWPDNRIWIFGLAHSWWSSPFLRSRVKKKFWAYDYENGKIRTWKEILSSSENTLSKNGAVRAQKVAQKNMKASNSDFHSNDRIARGVLAINAFINLFIANTGMNLSQALDIPWNTDLEALLVHPKRERLGFRAIKYRANNKEVFFEVGSEFTPLLRKYLKLRAYLLDGREFDFLFINFGPTPTKTSPPIKYDGHNFLALYKTLSKLLPDFPRIDSKQWRAAKQDFAIRNYDPTTASLVMQHSLPTALKAYSNGSEFIQNIELEKFLTQVQNSVIDSSAITSDVMKLPLGICKTPYKPNLSTESMGIEPNCKIPEGCLFCDKYRVSTEEGDLRKLFSARFCIRELSHFSKESSESIIYFEKILFRIEALLSELKSRDSILLDRIEREVDQLGELDQFWSSKREMLDALELI